MERDTNQMPQSVLCRSGCGFYGNPATDGLCSKCYKDALKKKQSTPTPAMTGRSSPSAATDATSSQASSQAKAESAAISAVTTASPTVTARSVTSSSQSEKTDSESLSNDGATACSASSPSSSDAGADKADTMDTESSTDSSDSSQREQKKKKSRCFTCRKKVGLTGFECRCGGLFCSLHRYSDKHECKFDYKQLGAQEIRKNNPLIVGKKIQKI